MFTRIRFIGLAFAVMLLVAIVPISSEALGPAHTESTVQVVLSEYQIDMPETIVGGFVTFQVANDGEESHGLVMTGQGFTRRLVRGRVDPGEQTTTLIRVYPGEYYVYSPAGNDAERGMMRRLWVVGGK